MESLVLRAVDAVLAEGPNALALVVLCAIGFAGLMGWLLLRAKSFKLMIEYTAKDS